MLPSNSKRLVQIAAVDDDSNQITWEIEHLREALEQSNGRRIKFVIVIGGFQNSKTSFISLTFGNDQHQIGDGYNEQTIGAILDGPYSIEELATRWNISEYENSEDNIAIYVIDVEGFGGFRRGETDSESQIFFTKLCSPLIAISSCIVLMANLNENRLLMNQLISAFRFGSYNQNIGNGLLQSQIIIMTLIRNIEIFNGIVYSDPNITSYTQISRSLTNNWQTRLFRESNCIVSTKPLPKYKNELSLFNQEDYFNKGFKFVVNDLLSILMNENSRMNTNNIDLILSLFQHTIDLVESFRFNEIQRSQNDFFMQSILLTVHNEVNSMRPSLDLFLNQYKERKLQTNLRNENELNENNMSDVIYNEYIELLDQFLHNRLNDVYFEIQEVINELNIIKQQIRNQIQSEAPRIIDEIKNIIIQTIINTINNMSPSLDSFLNQFTNQKKDSEKYNYNKVDLNENHISDQICNEYFQLIDQTLHEKLNIHYFQIQEIMNLLDQMKQQKRERIRLKVPQIIKEIDDYLYRIWYDNLGSGLSVFDYFDLIDSCLSSNE